jgi:hypothetical protein
MRSKVQETHFLETYCKTNRPHFILMPLNNGSATQKGKFVIKWLPWQPNVNKK